MDNPIYEILVCSTGDSWDVVTCDKAGAQVDEPEWCETKKEAMRVARSIFRDTPSAQLLKAERKRHFDFEIIRQREV